MAGFGASPASQAWAVATLQEVKVNPLMADQLLLAPQARAKVGHEKGFAEKGWKPLWTPAWCATNTAPPTG